MKKIDWYKRLAERSDLTSSLIHLTKPSLIDEEGEIKVLDVLFKILREKKLIGSTTQPGFICGKTPAVCFQDVPLYQLSQNIYYEQKLRETGKEKKIRYAGVGLIFDKTYVYDKGGRPVFYEQSSKAKLILPKDEWWRIVDLDLTDPNNITDWTHEREWRVKDNFAFELKDVTILLTCNNSIKAFIKKYKDEYGTDPHEDLKGFVSLQHLFF